MRALFLLVLCLLSAPITAAAEIVPGRDSGVSIGGDISEAYLRQARVYRAEGRYELARQSYAQALSTCKNNDNLYVIRRELAGLELLIRTMR